MSTASATRLAAIAGWSMDRVLLRWDTVGEPP